MIDTLIKMKKGFLKNLSIACLQLLGALAGGKAATAQNGPTLQVFTQKLTVSVNPAMWGIFFEDINFSADGGLYAELVKNRSFEFATPKTGWKKEGQGNILVNNRLTEKLNNPHYAAVTTNGSFRFTNEGFRGIGITAGEQYNFSTWIQTAGGTGQVNNWGKMQVTLAPISLSVIKVTTGK